MTRLLRQLSLVVCLVATSASVAHANGVYRYVEKDGTIIYTNVPPAKSVKADKLKGTFDKAAPKETSAQAPRNIRAISKAEFDEHIESAATRYKIPASLVRAVMQAESNYNPMAVSPKGASGLMQLMPGTAAEMFVKDIFDAKENIEGGTRYLRVLANQFNGDMVKMVAAYNAGPDAVRKYGGNVPPYAETQAYVKKVLALYFQFKDKAQPAP